MSGASITSEGARAHVMGDRARHAEYKLAALRSVLDDRERELLVLKGPCSTKSCRLHYAHSGPCDVKK